MTNPKRSKKLGVGHYTYKDGVGTVSMWPDGKAYEKAMTYARKMCEARQGVIDSAIKLRPLLEDWDGIYVNRLIKAVDALKKLKKVSRG